jgi:hypothetical protein
MDVMPYIVYYYDVKIAIELMKSLRVEIVSNMYAYSSRVILLASMHTLVATVVVIYELVHHGIYVYMQNIYYSRVVLY